MLGTPWYNVLSNDMYKEDFAYIGADVGEREKLIEDGYKEELDENGEITEAQIRTRAEQSDLVIVLLNLAVVPDSVVKQIKNFERGW